MAQSRGRRLLTSVGARAFNWTRMLKTGRIARLGSPRTVVDVGVGNGTPELYKAFPDAELLLVDPLVECEPMLKAICAGRTARCRYVVAALGSHAEQREMHVVPALIEHSSFLPRTELATTDPRVVSRTVQIRTLDDLLTDLAPTPPFGLKLDTEGFELDVIRGAAKFLEQTEFVIAEVSLLKRFEQSYRFSDFIAEMSRHGFEAFDVLTVVRPDPSGTRYTDLAFVKDGKR